VSDRLVFGAAIESAGGGGAFVRVPFDVEAAFGKKRVPVRATIDGVPYRGTLVRMGEPCHLLVVLKEIRERLGKEVGDAVDVTVEEDLEERKVELPADFAAALESSPPAGAFFATLSFTRQREYVLWIEGAKRPSTRSERIARSVAMLAEGKKLG